MGHFKVERLRQKSEEIFRGAFEYAPFGICVCGLDGRFIHANRAFSRMLGYSEQELLDTTWPDLIHPDDLGPAQLRQEQLWTGLIGCVDAEMRHMHRTGTVVWSRMRVSLVRDSGGSPLYSVVHVEDITERKRAEEALHESEDRFRIMADGDVGDERRGRGSVHQQGVPGILCYWVRTGPGRQVAVADSPG
jgi:PAS domain S-box-containing protein